jgi:DNA polymerase-3 subunit epsilon
LHLFINPDGRKVHPDALAVHGITDAFLADKPLFADIAESNRLLSSTARAMSPTTPPSTSGFSMRSIRRLGILLRWIPDMVIDTLSLARRRHPMGPNNLDALCRRYGIDNSHRSKHGALLDAELLTDVYIEMLGGRQAALGLSTSTGADRDPETRDVVVEIGERPSPLPPRLTDAEAEAHAKLIGRIGANAVWLRNDRG